MRYIALLILFSGCGYRVHFKIEPAPVEAKHEEVFFEVIDSEDLEEAIENVEGDSQFIE